MKSFVTILAAGAVVSASLAATFAANNVQSPIQMLRH